MSFSPKGKATITKLEGHNGTSDDAHARVDFGVSIEDQNCEVAKAVLGVDTVEEVERGFFRTASEDADQNSRFLGIKRLVCNAKWEGKHVLKIKGLRSLRVAKVAGVALVPRGHAKFDLTFNVSIEQPPAGYVDSLMTMMNKAVDFELAHDAGLFDKSVKVDYTPPGAKKASEIRSGKRLVKKATKQVAKKAAKKKPARARGGGTESLAA